MGDYDFRDAVCIDAPVVYDSCADRDCLEDLLVHFEPCDQAVINMAKNVRLRKVKVDFVCVDIEPILYQEGYYTVDITYIFKVKVDVCTCSSMTKTLVGECFFNKKVVLCGSEGNVKVFTSELSIDDYDEQQAQSTNLPKATVQVANPVGLDAKLCCGRQCKEDCCKELPECLCKKYNQTAIRKPDDKDKFERIENKCVLVTIGVFSIVQLERNVQLLIPACDFCVPTKECNSSTDSPCELFNKIDFPSDEFFPPQCESNCGCEE